jgi:hypothetical protein
MVLHRIGRGTPECCSRSQQTGGSRRLSLGSSDPRKSFKTGGKAQN